MYLAYAIHGLITSGMLPFLMPLMVASTTGDPGLVAYVIGAYNIGLLAALLLGSLAQRYQLFRPVFFGGFIALALGLGAATQSSAFGDWIPLALLCGAGACAAGPVLGIACGHERSRLGRLRTPWRSGPMSQRWAGSCLPCRRGTARI